ncbi:MAG: EAL domain-containing protein [Thermoanaerobaculia bacterium]
MIEEYFANGFALPTVVTAIAVLLLGSIVFYRERDSGLGPLFSLICLGVAHWLLSVSLVYSSRFAITALMWSRIAFLSIPLIPAAVYHFAAALIGVSRERRRMVLALWGVAAFFAATMSSTSMFVYGVRRFWWGYYPRLGASSIPFLLFSFGALAAAFRLLVVHSRSASSLAQRRRVEAFAIAFAVGYLALVDLIPSFGFPLYPFGYVAIGGFVVLAVRAEWRFRMTDFSPHVTATEILQAMQVPLVVTDLDGRIQLINHSVLEMLGYDEGELKGEPLRRIVESPFNLGRASDTLMRGSSIRDRAMLWLRKDRHPVEVSVSASMLRDADGVPVGMTYVASDITDRKRAEQIQYQAYHDALTGLPNRVMFRNRVDEAIAEMPGRKRTVAVFCLDLDGFKLINESMGHATGDDLLQAVATVLRSALRENDLVSRPGGDEFLILADLGKPSDGEIVAQKILEAVAHSYPVESDEVYLTGSLGIAVFPNHGEDAASLIKSSETGMYVAKSLGKNNYQWSGPATTEAIERLSLVNRLRRAVDNQEFVLHFQPVLDVRTDRIVSAEALLRWQTDQGLLTPDEFLLVAEDARLILPLGEWALREACRAAREWSASSPIPCKVAINLSAHQIQEKFFFRTVEEALRESGLDPHLVELELTESVALQNADRTLATLNDLKDLGVSLAIDDFGTGYSSLTYLRRFPIDTIKIDRSFVHGIFSESNDSAIVSAIIAMARAMNLNVIAEGVETPEQVAFLAERGCWLVQGYGVSRPLSEVLFSSFLSLDRRAWAAPSVSSGRTSLSTHRR